MTRSLSRTVNYVYLPVFKTLLYFVIFLSLAQSISAQTVSVKKWRPTVLSFESQNVLEWNTFPLQVTFTNGDNHITLDGYWDGGNVWKVRFAPTDSGTWTWVSSSTDNQMDGRSGDIVVTDPAVTDFINNPNYRGHVRVSSNNRYFEYDDGTPFFWIGDTNWALPYERCGVDNGNFYTYLDDRIGKKFTVLQIQFMSPVANNKGGVAINSYPGSWSDLNPNFFQSVDIRINEIWENGLVVAGHPTWFSEFSITLEEAKEISRYIWARYGAYNLVWSLSGEYSTSYVSSNNNFIKNDWQELGTFTEQLSGHSHPVSIHPRNYVASKPNVSFSSSHEFHDTTWLDHNWVQSFFYLEELTRQISTDYNREPTKPVVHAEGAYEAGYPESYNLVMDYEFIDGYLARYQAWSAYLNGAAGHTYGANGVWHMYDPSFPDPGLHDEHTNPWYEDLHLDGSSDMQHIRAFFSSLEWNTFEPLRSWLLVNGQPTPLPTASDITLPSVFGKWADTYVIYIPQGNSNNDIDILNLAGNEYAARWYNPRNGQYSDISRAPSFVSKWTIPARPNMEDWVVLLEATGATSSAKPNPISSIDNSNAGFSTVGSWGTSSSASGYYGSNYRYASAGSGSRQATWSFSVSAGNYELSAQWAAFYNRASNATYRVYDNGVEIGSQVFDQRVNGGRLNVFDTTFTVSGGTLDVVLTDDADGYVIADAVQVVSLESIGNLTPNGIIDTPLSAVTIVVGDTVDFAGTGSDPDNDLPLSYLWNFGDPAIADVTVEDPGLVQFDTVGSYTVSFTVTDSQLLFDPAPATVVVTVQNPSSDPVIPSSDPVIVDNTDAGFSTVGDWDASSFTQGYYGSNYRYAGPGSGSRKATWSFSVSAGDYALSAQWAAFDNRASNATYRVYNNGVEIGTQVFDQRVNGGRFNVFDTSYVVDAGTLDVVLTDDANGYVITDAVQVVSLGSGGNIPPDGGLSSDPVIVDNTDAENSTVGSWGASSFTPGHYGSNYHYADPGSGSRKATWSFSVSAGNYALSAQWAAFDNRASNATYRVYNNGVEMGTQIFDQRVNGGRFNVFDTSYVVDAGTLDVVLADDANGYVIGDAVRVVFLD